eukprot:1742432-Rhodomonas_salina.1
MLAVAHALDTPRQHNTKRPLATLHICERAAFSERMHYAWVDCDWSRWAEQEQGANGDGDRGGAASQDRVPRDEGEGLQQDQGAGSDPVHLISR